MIPGHVGQMGSPSSYPSELMMYSLVEERLFSLTSQRCALGWTFSLDTDMAHEGYGVADELMWWIMEVLSTVCGGWSLLCLVLLVRQRIFFMSPSSANIPWASHLTREIRSRDASLGDKFLFFC